MACRCVCSGGSGAVAGIPLLTGAVTDDIIEHGWFRAQDSATTGSATSINANILDFVTMPLPTSPRAFKGAGILANAAAGTNIIIGVYAPASDGSPGALLAQTNVIPVNSGGWKTGLFDGGLLTIPDDLGVVFISRITDVGTYPAVRYASPAAVFGGWPQFSAGSLRVGGRVDPHPFGPLPNPAPALTSFYDSDDASANNIRGLLVN